MKKLVHFYTEEKQRLETELKETKNKLANLSILRLIVFVLTSAGIYFLFDTLRIVGVIGAVGVIVFGILLIKYLDAKESKILLITKIKINETEIRVLEGNFSFLK
ncbi:DNA mismatch repair protein MutS, partial [Flavobacteriaceae bacterium]|nr:DNA mismatch repair protein MutS [Flavobacteriaceae bacterium]